MKSAAVARKNDLLRLDRQICFPIYAATNMLTRAYRSILDPLGLTYSQYLVMLVLWERSPVTVGELGECLYLETGTLTPLLKRMEQAGFITRRRDPEDERRVLVTLTSHGQSLRDEAASVPETLRRRLGLSTKASDDLRDTLRSMLEKLSSN